MARPDDDDALRWDGDDDPTLTPSGVSRPAPRAASAPAAAAPAQATLPEGFAAVGKGRDEVETVDAAGDPVAPGPAPMGNAMLVTVGVLGGVAATRSGTAWFREMKSEFAMAIPVSSLATAWSIGRRCWA